MLDLLGRPPGYHYIDTMRYDLAQMRSALQ
jgi:hypothetical protein